MSGAATDIDTILKTVFFMFFSCGELGFSSSQKHSGCPAARRGQNRRFPIFGMWGKSLRLIGLSTQWCVTLESAFAKVHHVLDSGVGANYSLDGIFH
jgi:hypothetical protein